MNASSYSLVPIFLVYAFGSFFDHNNVLAGAYSKQSLVVSTNGKTGFDRMDPSAVGISFSNTLQELTGASNRVLFNGSGVAAGDVDGDSKPDLFFCGLDSENHLYRNLGDFQFQRMSLPKAIALPGFPTRGAVFADVNADGSSDLLLTTVGGGCRLFFNAGDGTFHPAPQNGGIRSNGGASSIALADVDGNGSLDLYVTNNRTDDIRDYGRVNLRRVNGKLIPPDDLKDRLLIHNGQLHEYGEPDFLFLNDGKGKFTEASWTDGRFRMDGKALTKIPRDWGLSVTFRDLNGDLAPDIYVCNDYWTPDRVWINDGRGGFDELGPNKLSVTSSSSMGVDVADVNLDGYMDVFVVDMLSRQQTLRKRQQPAFNQLFEEPAFSGFRTQVMHNTLLMQQPDGSFIESAFATGLPASDWAWCPIFMDVDLDGDADVLVSSGYPHDVQDLDAIQKIDRLQHSWDRFKDPVALRKAFAKELMEHYRLYPKLNMPIIAYENQGDGSFKEATEKWGTHHLGVHQGFATGDLDGDGDLDLVVNNLGGSISIYKNMTPAPRVKVRLVGSGSNTQAIGARVVLKSTSMSDQQQEIIAGGRYVSGGDTEVAFAVLEGVDDCRLEIHWRDGTQSEVHHVQANHSYVIYQSEIKARPLTDRASVSPPLFEYFADLSEAKESTQFQSNPMARQPLLPLMIHPFRDCVVFSDSNQNGKSEWMMGGVRGGQLHGFELGSGSGLKHMNLSPSLKANVSGMVGMAPDQLLVSFDTKSKTGGGTLQFYDRTKNSFSEAGPSPESTSALAIGSMNGQGALAVFLGGSSKSGHYPQAHPSMLYQVTGAGLRRDTQNGVLLESLGMVHDAVWSDLNQDGFPELVVAAAWSPVRVFENRRGKLFDVSKDWGFAAYQGYWLSVTTCDLNGDGLLDVVAGNLGLNTPWQASDHQPYKLVYGTFSNPNVTDVIETVYHSDGTLAPLRLLDEIGNYLPFFYQQINNYHAYSEASLDILLRNRKGLSRTMQANTFSSMAFINQGENGFLPMQLPSEMQWGAVTDLSSGDIDGDGYIDIAYVQNQIWTRPEFGTMSDTRSGILMGHPSKDLVPADPSSIGLGLMMKKDGLRISDVDLDGRHDLLVNQKGENWKLYTNRRGKSGLNIIVNGPAHNPGALGTQLRVFDDSEKMSATLEVREDTSMPFKSGRQATLHAIFQPKGVWVRWPGGETKRYSVSSDAHEIEIDWANR